MVDFFPNPDPSKLGQSSIPNPPPTGNKTDVARELDAWSNKNAQERAQGAANRVSEWQRPDPAEFENRVAANERQANQRQ